MWVELFWTLGNAWHSVWNSWTLLSGMPKVRKSSSMCFSFNSFCVRMNSYGFIDWESKPHLCGQFNVWGPCVLFYFVCILLLDVCLDLRLL